MGKEWVYPFGEGKSEGNASMRQLLGGKGANLSEMTNLGIRVPPGFTITTAMCEAYYENKGRLPKDLTEHVNKAMKRVEKEMGKLTGNSMMFSASVALLDKKLGLLAAVSRTLGDRAVRQQLVAATDPLDMHRILAARIGGLA